MDENSNKYAIAPFAFMCSVKVLTIKRCNLISSSSLVCGLGGPHCKKLAVRKVLNAWLALLPVNRIKRLSFWFLFRFYFKGYIENTVFVVRSFPTLKR